MSYIQSMVGGLQMNGRTVKQAGFLNMEEVGPVLADCPSIPLVTRYAAAQLPESLTSLQRGEQMTGEIETIVRDLGVSVADFQRVIQSTMTGFPVRENLEAEAKNLVPMDTPVRNRLKRQKGSGLASDWFQRTTMGGGFAPASTASGANASGQAVLNVATGTGAQFAAADQVIVGSGSTQELMTVSSVAVDAITMTTNFANAHSSSDPIYTINRHPGSSQGYVRSFFAETGAPAEHTSTYVRKSASYKLLGTYGRVTGLAMAGGSNFQAQLAVNKMLGN